jgi:NADPH-dependent glutamate synthase beta subunit-like oxidoreductase
VKSGKKTKLGARVAVIGGGNTAIDAARTASRLGASEITIFYRRSPDEMPASDKEIEDALSEGVDIEFLVTPTRIQRKNGHLTLEYIRMRLGKPDASGRPCAEAIHGSESIFELDTIISAIGEISYVPVKFGLEQTQDGIQINPATMVTSKDGVFAGGDAVTGSASIIEAIAAGRKAATSIDKFLGGKGIIDRKLEPARRKVKPLNGMEELGDEGRVPIASLPIAKRIKSFNEVKLGYNSELAIKEAKRCLRCDANWVYTVNQDKCQGCYNCRVICPIEGCIAIKSKSL